MESHVVNELGLDFDEVYKRTNTSYKPIFIENPNDNDSDETGYLGTQITNPLHQ